MGYYTTPTYPYTNNYYNNTAYSQTYTSTTTYNGYNAMHYANNWYPGWNAYNYRWHNNCWWVYMRHGHNYRTVYIAPHFNNHWYHNGYHW
jgi:hypothetical protein